MARFHGKVGFIEPKEIEPGIWEDTPVEKSYTGVILSAHTKWEENQSLNDNLTLSTRVAITMNTTQTCSLGYIRYVSLHGQRWCVTKIDVQAPKVILSIGGLYNGPIPS